MIPKKVENEFNKQIQEETYSAYLYWQMAAYFEGQNLPGFAKWLEKQAGEEMEHALRFYRHIHDRMGNVELLAINKPPKSYKSSLDAFKAAFAHEQHITGRINFLLELCHKEKDHAGAQMLQWFVQEQVEEEEQADAVVQKLKMVQGTQGLYMLDKEMAQRKEN